MAGQKHKASMYDIDTADINAILIKEVRERLRNGTYELEIDNKLIVKHHGSRCAIYFQNEQHFDIYSVDEGESSREKADKIRHELRQTFSQINSCKEIHDNIRRINDFASQSEIFRKKLDLTLRQILSKVNINIVYQCSYLRPGLD